MAPPSLWPRPRPRPHTASSDTRDAYIDNIKGVLIALVVLGHTLGQMLGAAPGSWTLYTWLYLFHMPAFAVLSGMLTSGHLDARRIQGLIQTILAPYLILQVAYFALYNVAGPGKEWTGDVIFTPLYQLWFLAALFVWRMMSPLFTAVRPAVGMALAVVMSLLAGVAPALNDMWALDRTVAMLPFFVCGLYAGRRALPQRCTRTTKGVAVVALIAALPISYGLNTAGVRQWSSWNTTYEALGVQLGLAIPTRLGMLTLGVALAASVFVLVPRKRSMLTRVGNASMYPYLFHGFATLGFGWSIYDKQVTSVHGAMAVLVLALCLTAVLASGPAQRLLRPVVMPNVSILFTRPAAVDDDPSLRPQNASRRGSWPLGASRAPHVTIPSAASASEGAAPAPRSGDVEPIRASRNVA